MRHPATLNLAHRAVKDGHKTSYHNSLIRRIRDGPAGGSFLRASVLPAIHFYDSIGPTSGATTAVKAVDDNGRRGRNRRPTPFDDAVVRLFGSPRQQDEPDCHPSAQRLSRKISTCWPHSRFQIPVTLGEQVIDLPSPDRLPPHLRKASEEQTTMDRRERRRERRDVRDPNTPRERRDCHPPSVVSNPNTPLLAPFQSPWESRLSAFPPRASLARPPTTSLEGKRRADHHGQARKAQGEEGCARRQTQSERRGP
jgi:hypothetical protein